MRVIYVEVSVPHLFLILPFHGPGLLCLWARERQRMQRISEVNTRSGGYTAGFPGHLISSGSGGCMVPVNSDVGYCTAGLLGASEIWAPVTEVALEQAGAFSEPGLTFRIQL